MPGTSPPLAAPTMAPHRTTAFACPPCGLRFERSAGPVCPQCERPLVTLGSAEQAVGLRLYRTPDISLPALAAAIAAQPDPRRPPRA